MSVVARIITARETLPPELSRSPSNINVYEHPQRALNAEAPWLEERSGHDEPGDRPLRVRK